MRYESFYEELSFQHYMQHYVYVGSSVGKSAVSSIAIKNYKY